MDDKNKINGDKNVAVAGDGNDMNIETIINESIENHMIKLKKELKISMLSKPHVPYVKLLLWITGLSIAFFILFILLNHFIGFGISDDSIVLAFVGILATFVVVSNYIQVNDIGKKFDEKIKGIIDESIERDTKAIELIRDTMKIYVDRFVSYNDLIDIKKSDTENLKYIFKEIQTLQSRINDIENKKNNPKNKK